MNATGQDGPDYLYALFDDGSIWARPYGGPERSWSRIPPIEPDDQP